MYKVSKLTVGTMMCAVIFFTSGLSVFGQTNIDEKSPKLDISKDVAGKINENDIERILDDKDGNGSVKIISDKEFMAEKVQNITDDEYVYSNGNLIGIRVNKEDVKSIDNEDIMEIIKDLSDGDVVNIDESGTASEEEVEAPVGDSMQTRGITTYVKNGSAQKYGKEYSPKSGDKFVLSVAKGETVVLTKEITKSSKYKIESGVALEVGSITQGLASSMTAKYTKSTKYTGPTTKGTNTREYRVKFYRQKYKRKQTEYRKITNTKLKEENIIFSIPSKYLKYSIDKKVK